MNKNTIILLSSKISGGKDTCTRMIEEELSSSDTIVHHEKFAAYLKEICSTVFQPLFDAVNPIFEDAGLNDLVTNKENFYENRTIFARYLMQLVGTNLIRYHVDENFWISHLAKVISEKLDSNPTKDNVVIVSDWRFRNELELISYINQYRQNYTPVDVKLVRITRPSVSPKTSASFHPSELDLDDFKGFNYHINNSGSLETLRSKVKIMLAEFGLSK